jgi:dihydrofolate reductase
MISMIVAYARGRVIGKEGKIPWHLPADLRRFKKITRGQVVVMGFKTFEMLGRPLPQRRNIVLTHRSDIDIVGVEALHSKDEVLALGDVFIIGGESVYRQFLEEAERLYITEIDIEVDGDTFFPQWDRRSFNLLDVEQGRLDAQNSLPHTFYVYERKKRPPA